MSRKDMCVPCWVTFCVGGAMNRKRNIGTMAALGGFTAAVALMTALPANADELADLRANQELLQRRVDQLAQVPPPPPPAGPGGPVMTGSFPRSFVIPGTEVSLRVGGQGVGSVLWYLKGQAVGGALNGQGGFNETYVDGQGGTGNLPSIPLNTHTFRAGTAVGSAAAPVGFAHSRSSEWEFSGKQTRFFFDARTPSPYGQVKAYIEMDFSASNTNTILNANAGVTNGYIPRLRQGYATLGGLLMGQTTGTFVDNDANPELLDIGGTTGASGRARSPMVRYTYPLPYGMTVAAAAENPNADFSGPFGEFGTDTNQIPSEASCAALTQTALTTTTTNAATNITNACLGITAFGARIGYQHWWTPQLRSTIDFSMRHADISTFYVPASGRNSNDKELNLAHANLIWSPVAFVDLGIEGAWGHRVTVGNQRGDAWTLQSSLKFRF